MSRLDDIPVGEGIEATLPSSWYLRDDVFALEREHIFLSEWVCAGRDEDLPNPGDHKVLSLYGESILLLRNREGALRAFYNVCRHRGARLCVAETDLTDPDRVTLKGGVMAGRSILCPYHSWTYNLDGQLIGAPHMPETGFDKASVRLHPVGVETWGGFIFLHLTPAHATPFADLMARQTDYLKRYPLSDLRAGPAYHYEVAANWKVICENYNECYHCGPVHPELCRLVPAFKDRGGADLDWDRGVLHRDGADTFTTTGTTTRRAFPGLNDDEKLRHKGDLFYPNMFLSLAKDHVAVFILEPKGPAHTSIDCYFLFEPHEMDKPDFDPSDAADFWHLVNRQDWAICERVQQGLTSRVHSRGIFSPMEDWNLDIRRYVTDRIGHLIEE